MSEKFDDPAKSVRDAFFKILDGAIPTGASLLRAEDTNSQVLRDGKYDDFLRFESDIAQVCELVLLFCESEGSLCELGSFCSTEDIRSRMMVVVEDQHFNAANSYIKLGPLTALLNEDDSAVVTFTFDGLGGAGRDPSKIDLAKLRDLLRPRIERRLASIDAHTSFNPSREGHVIKALVGFTQEFGALLRDEVLLGLQHIGANLSDAQLRRFVLCGEQIGWIKERRKGDRWLILANPSLGDMATTFQFKKGEMPTSALRRRAAILDHWREHDLERHGAIIETRGALWAS